MYLIFAILTQVASLEIFLNNGDKTIENITQQYFDDKNCLTIIQLTKYNPELIYSQYIMPTIVRSVNLTKYKPNFNLTKRPRRDKFDQKRIIQSLCSENTHAYLIIVKMLNDLFNYIFMETIMPFWSPQASIFIYFTEDPCQNTTIIFENLWRIYKTPHVVISGYKCTILFYNPYKKNDNSYGKLYNFTKQQVLDDINIIKNGMKAFDGYPLKTIMFKSAYSVPISSTEYVGIDVNLATTIADYNNMTTKIIPLMDNELYGFLLPNGSYTGGIGALLTGEVDYLSVDYFIKDYLTLDIEFSTSISTDNLCVIMKKAEKIPDWQLLYYCLDNITWLCIIAIYFIISFSWILIQYVLTKFMEDAVIYPFVFTDTFRLMITSSLYRMPTILSERIFVAFCLMAFVTLVGAFQGSLFGVYSSLMFYKDINTLEDLSKTDTKIKSRFMFFIDDVFSDTSYPMIAKLKSMISFYDDPISITLRVATQHNFATLVRQSEVQVDNSTTTFLDQNGLNLIHMVKECPRTYSLANILPVNSQIAPVINKYLLRIAQAGLVVKWYEEMAYNVSASRRNDPDLSEALKVFSLKDMQIAFFELIIGIAISTFVCIVEVCIKK